MKHVIKLNFMATVASIKYDVSTPRLTIYYCIILLLFVLRKVTLKLLVNTSRVSCGDT